MSEEATVSDETTEASTEQTEEGVSAPETDSEEQATGESEQTESTEESFTDVKVQDLPPELQGQYKEMQGAFTRKMQELAAAKEKAQLYDQLQQQELLDQKFPQPKEEAETETVDLLAQQLGVPSSQLEPEQRQQLEMLAKLIDSTVEKRVTQTVQPLQQDLLTRDYKQELSEVQKKYPDFDKYTEQVKQALANNPAMTYEQAYMVASFEDQRKAGRNEALKNREVKKAQSSPKKTTATTTGDPKGFDNIVKWAMNSLK